MVGTSAKVVVGGPDVLKVAVTDRACVMATIQVVLVPEQAPLHPEKTDPASGEAVNVTFVPLGKEALHVVPQLIPAGVLVTVPLPPPALVTDRV